VCREERGTDKSADKCRLRYRVFRQHYPALTQLQSLMPFSVIDATGSLEECEAQIAHELRYQSSLDLDERTYAAVARIPLAREVVQHSRQHLVQRLDEYQLSQTETFHKVWPPAHRAFRPAACPPPMSGHACTLGAGPLVMASPAACPPPTRLGAHTCVGAPLGVAFSQ